MTANIERLIDISQKLPKDNGRVLVYDSENPSLLSDLQIAVRDALPDLEALRWKYVADGLPPRGEYLVSARDCSHVCNGYLGGDEGWGDVAAFPIDVYAYRELPPKAPEQEQ